MPKQWFTKNVLTNVSHVYLLALANFLMLIQPTCFRWAFLSFFLFDDRARMEAGSVLVDILATQALGTVGALRTKSRTFQDAASADRVI